MLKLSDFLPKYPQINKTELDFYNGNFNQNIYDKKEFYENKLGINPLFPEEKGTYMKHQNTISRFLSSHTPYTGVMIFHEMGTGKSCATIATTELLIKENIYKKVLYLAPSETLIENFQNELINKCTKNVYNKKNLKVIYNFDTYDKFTTKIVKNKVNAKKYKHFVIILDEVHNISATTNNYEHIKKFLHNIKNCKILLLSGTPMVNNSKEFLEMMNLILPDEEINIEERSIYNKQDIEYFKQKFKGRISYLKAKSDSNIKKEFVGKILDGFKEFKLVDSKMSSFQSNVYNKILSVKKDKSSFYLDEIQASLFVYPDGSYGTKGFKKYITSKGAKKKLIKNSTLKWSLNSKYSSEFTKENIKKFSSKYYQTIKIIQEAEKLGKIVFVFNNSVEQSGIILFSLLLKLYGYSRLTKYSSKTEISDRKRYILLTGNSGKKEIKGLISELNKPTNKNGQKIRVVLGSNIVSEGFTFKNVQTVVIQTPHWNYSKLTQAIARSYRAGSHKDLEGGKDLKVQIYQQAAIPSGGIKDSIDCKMYKYSEDKDIEIKKMERLVKESSFDCALNYDRNISVSSQNKSRECEYTDCNYKCDGILSDENGYPLVPKQIDNNTFNLFYSKKEVKNTEKEIITLFRTIFKIKYEDIKTKIRNKNDFILLKALENLINNNSEIYSKYGTKCFLREDKNIYYLVDNLLNFNNFLSNYYIKFPFVYNSNISKKIDNLNSDEVLEIKKLCSMKSESDIANKIFTLSPQIVNILLEQSYKAVKLNINKNKTFRDIVYNLTKSFIVNDINFYLWSKNKTSIVTNFIKDKNDWENVSAPKLEKTLVSIVERFETLNSNNYGLYGIIEYQGSKPIFKIRILDKKSNIGKNITSFTSKDLALICSVNLKLPIPKKFSEFIKTLKGLDKIIKNDKDFKNISDLSDKLRFLYWNSKKIFNKYKIKSSIKIKAENMRDKIKDFLRQTKWEGISLVQNQKLFDIYKFYSELEDI